MRRHLAYLKYLIRHKWFVFKAGWRIGVPLWRLVMHDMSKFLQSEWMAYARTFYEPNGEKRYVESPAFDAAWLKHQHRNPHHWQHWILRNDSGSTAVLPMPAMVVAEMVADWAGAGRAITGDWGFAGWCAENLNGMQLHPDTRATAEGYIRALADQLGPHGSADFDSMLEERKEDHVTKTACVYRNGSCIYCGAPEPAIPKCGNGGEYPNRNGCEYDEDNVCIHCGEEIPY